MSQRETILRMLEQAGDRGVTSQEFYDVHLPRFPARIHELKNKFGYDIGDEPEGRFKRYKLRANNSSSLEGPRTACGNALQEPERAAGEFTSSAAPSLPGSDGSANQPDVGLAGASRSAPVISGQVGGGGSANPVESVPLEDVCAVETPAISSRSYYEIEAEHEWMEA